MDKRKYPDELRARATRMAVEARQDPDTNRGAITRGSEERRDVNREALRNWVRQAEVDYGIRPGTTTGDSARIAERKKRLGSCAGRTQF